MYIPIILAILLSLLHLFSDYFANLTKKYYKQLLSLSAGILLTIIFLELLPQIIEGTKIINDKVYIFLLLGFISFHLLEKEICHHIHNKKILQKEITNVHSLAFFLEHFIIGATLVLLTTAISFIILIPFILLTISSSILLQVIHKTSKSKTIKIILASSTTIGALTATFITLNPQIYYPLFSFITGTLIYIVARDIIPQEEKIEKTFFFLLGILITLFFLSITLW